MSAMTIEVWDATGKRKQVVEALRGLKQAFFEFAGDRFDVLRQTSGSKDRLDR